MKIYCSFTIFTENSNREVEKYKMVENSDLNLKCDFWVFLVAQMVKNRPAMQEMLVQSVDWKDPWRREWQPTPIFLPGEFHGQRSLAGYSPEPDTTE